MFHLLVYGVDILESMRLKINSSPDLSSQDSLKIGRVKYLLVCIGENFIDLREACMCRECPAMGLKRR